MDISDSMFNYSFWSDEAYVSGIAMRLVTGKLSFFNALNAPAIAYQRLQMLIIGMFFRLFGVYEFTARLPSLIAFIIGIPIIFLTVKKLSNIHGAMVSTFLYAFSVLNLAYATQAKPYSLLEVIMMTIILLLIYLSEEKRIFRICLYNFSIIGFLIIATLLHNIGVLFWTLYFIYIALSLKRYRPQTYLIFGIITFIGGIFVLPIIFSSIKSSQLFPYNNLYQSVKLFMYKYVFISVCAFFGYIWIFKKYKTISIIIFFYSAVVFFMATFRVYIFNIRYVLSLFAILFLYFGIFWAKAGERYMPKKPWIIPITVMILVYATGYKIVRWPQTYYNPNIDKYGDIQIANYKDFYAQLKNKFPNYKNLYVVDDTYDVEYWYFGRYSNAYFMKFTSKPYKHHTVNAMIYGSLKDFKKIMKDHPQGLLIMEDWQSFLPEDVKQYAKKNLRLEFRVDSLKEAPDDPWPLALYSWGINSL